MDIVPVDRGVSNVYASTHVALRSAGTPIPSHDAWIAASAMRAASALLTFDGDVRRVPGLRCIVLAPRQSAAR